VVLKRYEWVMFQEYDPVLNQSVKVSPHAACFLLFVPA